MKVNKWTLGLAAVGLVSLVPGVRGDDAAKPVPVTTALSATTISGYVDTSMVWNPGTGNAFVAPYAFNSPSKHDGFNIDLIDIKIAKAEDDGPWGAGYVAELNFGPDSQGITGGAGPAPEYIRQAYVDLKVPLGNLDIQVGRFDQLLGYEGSDSYKNPNWTRSYGYTLEPTEDTGVLLNYKFSDAVLLQMGVANTVTTGALNSRNGAGWDGVTPVYTDETKKALISLLTLTAPDSWGWVKGSTLVAGFDYGQGPVATAAGGAPAREEGYLGATLNLPVKGLAAGACWDFVNHEDVGGVDTGYASAEGMYLTYSPTDKLTLAGRAELANGNFLTAGEGFATVPGTPAPFHDVFALTGTVTYNLWANVISRLELRWDKACNGAVTPFGAAGAGGFPTKKNEVMLAANIIYKF